MMMEDGDVDVDSITGQWDNPLVYDAKAQSVISSGSQAPSRYSYAASRDGRTLFREVAGRKLNDTNDQYLLPSGEFHRPCFLPMQL